MVVSLGKLPSLSLIADEIPSYSVLPPHKITCNLFSLFWEIHLDYEGEQSLTKIPWTEIAPILPPITQHGQIIDRGHWKCPFYKIRYGLSNHGQYCIKGILDLWCTPDLLIFFISEKFYLFWLMWIIFSSLSKYIIKYNIY